MTKIEVARDEIAALKERLESYLICGSEYLQDNNLLKAENERLRKDAERYRWFCNRFERQTFYFSEDADSIYGYQLDAAIDAAMTADTKGE